MPYKCTMDKYEITLFSMNKFLFLQQFTESFGVVGANTSSLITLKSF